MPNVNSAIHNHNKSILHETKTINKTCNCIKKGFCPLKNLCLTSNLVYVQLSHKHAKKLHRYLRRHLQKAVLQPQKSLQPPTLRKLDRALKWNFGNWRARTKSLQWLGKSKRNAHHSTPSLRKVQSMPLWKTFDTQGIIRDQQPQQTRRTCLQMSISKQN